MKIEIGDTERATTDAEGYYKLDQVSYVNPILQFVVTLCNLPSYISLA